VDWDENDWDHKLLVKRFSIRNSIRSICRGSDNALWFGTLKNGRIYRWPPRDGSLELPCTECTQEPEKVLDEDGGLYETFGFYSVQTITEDSDRNLWFGISGYTHDFGEADLPVSSRTGKVLRYDRSSWVSFENIFGGDKEPSVFDAVADDQGGVWFAGNGVRYWDAQEQRFTTYYAKEDGIGSDFVNCLILDDDGNLWCGTSAGGIRRFDGTKWSKLSHRRYAKDADVSKLEEHIQEVILDLRRRKPLKVLGDRIGYKQGVVKEDMISSAAKDSRGRLWFGTYGGGVLVFRGGDPEDRNSWDHFTAANTSSGSTEGLLGNIVLSIGVDPQDRIWIGTLDGISCLDHKGTRDRIDDLWTSYRVEMLTIMGSSEVHSYSSAAWDIAFEEDGTPWFATELGGLLHLKNP
jgi:ligand-binding sensor domain-containing protein